MTRKKPYKTPWDGDPVKRLDEDRQWSELSRLVQQGLVSADAHVKVARMWTTALLQRAI